LEDREIGRLEDREIERLEDREIERLRVPITIGREMDIFY